MTASRQLVPAPKRKRRAQPTKQDIEIRRLSARGMTYCQIGALFALSEDQVYRIASGLVRPDEQQQASRTRKPNGPTAQDIEVRRLSAEGMTYGEIAHQLRLSE